MLAVNELGKLLRVCFVQSVEIDALRAQRGNEAVQTFLRRLRAIGGVEKLTRVIHTSLEDVIVRDAHLVEFIEHRLGLLSGDRAEPRHFTADLLDLFVLELPQQLGADIFAESDEQNRHLTDTRKLLRSW